MVAMSDTLADAFRRNVRERMATLKLSQSALAERLECTPSFISQMLSGHRNPGLDSLEIFAKALDTEPPELIREKSSRKMSRAS
jgi:transcriptional regulator with XRE-family HTH domain